MTLLRLTRQTTRYCGGMKGLLILQFYLLGTLVWLRSVRADSGPEDYAELDPARDPSTPLLPGANGPEVVALQNALAGNRSYFLSSHLINLL